MIGAERVEWDTLAAATEKFRPSACPRPPSSPRTAWPRRPSR
ncbi:hypothetical protein NKH77_54010 [Streptomyces sp. M19]